MVRNDNAICYREQDQLPVRRGRISPRLAPGGRRAAPANADEKAISGRRLDNTISAEENITHAASRKIDSEWFWDP